MPLILRPLLLRAHQSRLRFCISLLVRFDQLAHSFLCCLAALSRSLPLRTLHRFNQPRVRLIKLRQIKIALPHIIIKLKLLSPIAYILEQVHMYFSLIALKILWRAGLHFITLLLKYQRLLVLEIYQLLHIGAGLRLYPLPIRHRINKCVIKIEV